MATPASERSPVEFIGMIGTQRVNDPDSPSVSITGGVVDPDFVKEFARAHEAGDYAAAVTDRLGFLIAHRPGFVQPTLAARKFATLDHFSRGRIAVHIITGGSDAEQERDGDWLDHDTRYRRTDEYLSVVRRVWTSAEPFDHEGEFYRIRAAFSQVKPLQQPHIPVYFGGASDAAIQAGARHADVYALWGETIAEVKERVAEFHAAAAPFGRRPRISVSLRPILGATEEQAWERAHRILERIQAARPGATPGVSARPQSVGSQRLLDIAARGEVHDKRLWTPIAAATGAGGNTTALVGTPEQVVEALLDYYDAGVTTLLIRGFDPLQDAIEYGRDLIPLVRQEVAHRNRQAAVA
jgi:alkanesulfonate monooxygenase